MWEWWKDKKKEGNWLVKNECTLLCVFQKGSERQKNELRVQCNNVWITSCTWWCRNLDWVEILIIGQNAIFYLWGKVQYLLETVFMSVTSVIMSVMSERVC